jgi:hypothetical protein
MPSSAFTPRAAEKGKQRAEKRNKKGKENWKNLLSIAKA